jgi:hypothetical protein
MNAVEFFFALSAVTSMTAVAYLWTRFVYRLDREDSSRKSIDVDGPSAAPLAQDVSSSRTYGASGAR